MNIFLRENIIIPSQNNSNAFNKITEQLAQANKSANSENGELVT